MTAELEALAVRCEQASGLDHSIDAEIALVVAWSKPRNPGACGPGFSGRCAYEWHDPNGVSRGFYPPKYTASLDAAMTLVPEGWHTALSGSDYGWKAEISPPSGLGNGWRSALCKISPLAITAAALRAITPTQNHKGPHDE